MKIINKMAKEEKLKLKISVTLESKDDAQYSSWKDVFTKVSDETLVLTTETATIESLQKIVKNNMNDVLTKVQNYIEVSELLKKEESNLL
jgi:hypothetical protein